MQLILLHTEHTRIALRKFTWLRLPSAYILSGIKMRFELMAFFYVILVNFLYSLAWLHSAQTVDERHM